MARSKKAVEDIVYSDPPETLQEHPFYGLTLDDDQKALRDSIYNKNKDIVFVNAKAGTGKTVVSLGTANLLVQYGLYKKIIYVCSPCNEHRVGFLPGDITTKSEVYYEPLYSAMQTLGINPFTAIDDNSLISQKYDSGGYIKPMTDVYLRGCNLDDAIVICDEMQNFTFDICKKVLTRACKNTKVICIGHDGQTDLLKPEESGFVKYIQHFASEQNTHRDKVAVCVLTHNHRHWIAEWADELKPDG